MIGWAGYKSAKCVDHALASRMGIDHGDEFLIMVSGTVSATATGSWEALARAVNKSDERCLSVAPWPNYNHESDMVRWNHVLSVLKDKDFTVRPFPDPGAPFFPSVDVS